jgi:lysophospholipase L1-like esterase
MSISLVVSLAILEFGLRLAAPQPRSWLDIYQADSEIGYKLQGSAIRHIDTGESVWTARTSDAGWRIADSHVTEAGEPETLGLLFLGDSYTFGLGVDYDDCFVGRFEADAGVNCLNAGVPGYGPVQYAQVVRRLLDQQIRPTRVVLMFYVGNDFFDCVWNKRVDVVNGVLGGQRSIKAFAKEHSHLYRLLSRIRHTYAPTRFDATTVDRRMATEDWSTGELLQASQIVRSMLQQIRDDVAMIGGTLYVVPLPSRAALETIQGVGGRIDEGDRPLRELRSIIDELRIPAIDVVRDLVNYPTDELYFAHDGHFTPAGHGHVANRLESELH